VVFSIYEKIESHSLTVSIQIEDGEIHATINQKDGMVSFDEDPEQYKSSEMVEHIDSSIQRYVPCIFYHYLLIIICAYLEITKIYWGCWSSHYWCLMHNFGGSVENLRYS
jgi:hypothetical protein